MPYHSEVSRASIFSELWGIDAGAFTTTNGNLTLIMEDSDLEGCQAVGSSKWKFWTSIKT